MHNTEMARPAKDRGPFIFSGPLNRALRGRDSQDAGVSRKELAAKLAAQTGMSKDAADKAVANVFGLLADELASGNQVSLHGFGIFSVTETQARTGRNPTTGETKQIQAGRKVRFKPAANLKRSLE